MRYPEDQEMTREVAQLVAAHGGHTYKDGVLHAYQHETEGLPLAITLLQRLTGETRLMEYVLNLNEYHMKPNTVAAAQSPEKTTTRLCVILRIP